MKHRTELDEATKAATRLATALAGDEEPSGGSLVAVGTGIRAISQLTLETIAEITRAEALFYVIGEPQQEEVVKAINPVAEDLSIYYVEGMNRIHTYEAMVQHILAAVFEGKRTVAAFYGHPGVFTYPTHESVRRARAAGYPARMLPAVSAADCLYADLGVDPGDGSQAYEATDFLYGDRPVDGFSHLTLWQIGGLGSLTYETMPSSPSPLLRALVEKLLRTYPPRHPVTIYEAPFDPTGLPRIERMPVTRLPAAFLTPASTLHIPPVPVPGR